MADKRMFHKDIIESDAFMDMPMDSQMLYIHLNLAADDLGFVGRPRAVMRSCGASNDSLKLLIAKKFVLTFDKGDNFVVLIKHWRMQNSIRADRLKESQYKELLRDVFYDENKSYSMNPGDGHVPCLTDGVNDVGQLTTKRQPVDNQLPTNCVSTANQVVAKIDESDDQTVVKTADSDNQVATKCQHSIDKYSIDKSSVVEISKEEDRGVGEGETKPPDAPVDQGSITYDSHTQNSIDYAALIRFYLKLGKNDKANHYYTEAKKHGIEIDVEAIKAELDGASGT